MFKNIKKGRLEVPKKLSQDGKDFLIQVRPTTPKHF
jgi:hypothetical protein